MRISEIVTEDLRKWFKEKWVRFGPDGKIRGECARGSKKEGKLKCLPKAKAYALGKKKRASAAAKKRREDPNPNRKGAAKNVATKVRENQGYINRRVLLETRKSLYKYLKSLVPTFPDYVVRDWLYANLATGNVQTNNYSIETLRTDLPEILKGVGLTTASNWQFVPNMKFDMGIWEPITHKRLTARAGGNSVTTDPDVHIPKNDAERHVTQAELAKKQGGIRKEPVILISTPSGYELLEGWHRTIQHFSMYPNGYTGPAYVAKSNHNLSESPSSLVNQDQAERNEYSQFVKSQANGDWARGAKMYAQSKNRSNDDIFGEKERLQQFMKMKFDFDKFNDADWDDYWLLSQHCDSDREFQKHALATIKKYQGKDHKNYQYLYDRISCGLTGSQRYGTQNVCKIDADS